MSATISTSAIEGVKLDPDEVRSSIMRRLGLGASQDQIDRLSPAAARLEELGVIESDPTAGGRSTRYRVRLPNDQPLQLIRDLNWS